MNRLPWDLVAIFFISCGWLLFMVEFGVRENGALKRWMRIIFRPAIVLYFLGLIFMTLWNSEGVGLWYDAARYLPAISTFAVSGGVVLAVFAINPFLSLALYGKMPVGVAVANFMLTLAFATAFAFRPSGMLQLATMLALPSTVLAGLLCAVVGWKRAKLKPWAKVIVGGAAVVAPLFAFFLALDLGRVALCGYLRVYRQDMEDVARRVSETKKTEAWSGAPVQFRSGVPMVWWGGGFPVRHTVFAWIPGGDEKTLSELRKDWRVQPIPCAEGWYRLSNGGTGGGMREGATRTLPPTGGVPLPSCPST